MADHIIRVRIVAADCRRVHVVPVDDVRDCRRCAEGNGCGSRPWFRVFLDSGSISLPNREQWQPSETADLHLSGAGLQYSALLTYGLPLAAFLLTLITGQNLGEGRQLLQALAALIAVTVLSRPLRARIIRRHLRLVRRHERATVVRVG